MLPWLYRFESLAQAFFTEEFRVCKDHLRHKTSMISPLQIQKAGIAYTTAVQVRRRQVAGRREEILLYGMGKEFSFQDLWVLDSMLFLAAAPIMDDSSN